MRKGSDMAPSIRFSTMCCTAAALLAIVFLLAPAAWAGNVLQVRANDVDGAAQGYVQYFRWDDTAQAYKPLHSRYVKKGLDRIALAPGKYWVKMTYTETCAEQIQEEKDIVLDDGQERECFFYFPKGVAEFSAQDNDTCVTANAMLTISYCDGNEFKRLKSRRIDSSMKWDDIFLAPGIYKVRFDYLETRPHMEYAERTFEIKDGEVVSILGLFQHGPWEKISEIHAEEQVNGPMDKGPACNE